MNLPPINQQSLLDFLIRLLNTPSPTGYTSAAVELTLAEFSRLPGVSTRKTRKGALIATAPGARSESPRAVSAHVDTLGAMVKEIKANGRLRLTAIGGLPWNAVEAEGCTVFASGGAPLRGSVLPEQASVHVYGARVSENKRSDSLMEVRLDARTASAAQTAQLGVSVGDFVAFDPRVEVNEGFIRSRFLDDKAGVACVLAALQALLNAGMQPAQTTHFLISVYEEVSHGGAAGLPPDVAEMLVVDMAAIGEGQNSDEQHTSICVKDNFSPYDHAFSTELRRLADRHQIPYQVDIYPYYSSDGSVLWRSGSDARVALIGPGVDASHHYERTTLTALVDTARWIAAYLLADGDG